MKERSKKKKWQNKKKSYEIMKLIKKQLCEKL